MTVIHREAWRLGIWVWGPCETPSGKTAWISRSRGPHFLFQVDSRNLAYIGTPVHKLESYFLKIFQGRERKKYF